jgi:hypothetical protein
MIPAVAAVAAAAMAAVFRPALNARLRRRRCAAASAATVIRFAACLTPATNSFRVTMVCLLRQPGTLIEHIGATSTVVLASRPILETTWPNVSRS